MISAIVVLAQQHNVSKWHAELLLTFSCFRDRDEFLEQLKLERVEVDTNGLEVTVYL